MATVGADAGVGVRGVFELCPGVSLDDGAAVTGLRVGEGGFWTGVRGFTAEVVAGKEAGLCSGVIAVGRGLGRIGCTGMGSPGFGVIAPGAKGCCSWGNGVPGRDCRGGIIDLGANGDGMIGLAGCGCIIWGRIGWGCIIGGRMGCGCISCGCVC